MVDNLYRDLRHRLTEAGCLFVRQGKGSHEIWFSPLTSRRFTLPSKIKKTSTANGIMKEAGLDKVY